MKKKQVKRIAIIGVGNEYRGDDAAGVFIARKIEDEKLPGVNVFIQSGEGAALIEAWQDFDFVVIVDASRSNSSAGKIFRFDAKREKLPDSFFSYSTHAFSVAEAVELARVLNRLPPRLIVYAVEGKNFEIGVGLSPEIERAIGKVCRSMTSEITANLKMNAEEKSHIQKYRN